MSPEGLDELKEVLQTIPTALLKEGDIKPVVIDTGASRISSGFRDDFVPGTLKKLKDPYRLDGIAGSSSSATHEGVVKYEVLGDNGSIVTVKAKGLFLTDLGCRLYSPQYHFKELKEQGKSGGSVEIFWDKAKLKLPGNKSITIPLDNNTFLPIMKCFKSAEDMASSLALT